MKTSKVYALSDIADPGVDAPLMLMAAGRLSTFRVFRGKASVDGDKLTIDAEAAKALGVSKGDEIRAVEW